MTKDTQLIHADVAVIGGGSAGLAAALRAGASGHKTVMLEPAALGGTCVNVGCVPKKAMWLASDAMQRIASARHMAFSIDDYQFDWKEFVVARQAYIQNIHKAYRERLDASDVMVIPAYARFSDPQTLEADDGTTIKAKYILICTGGRPSQLKIKGGELADCSDDFFAYDAAPKNVAIIGGGYIGMELAGVLHGLGSKVTLVLRGEHVLNGFDAEITAALLEHYVHKGIEIRQHTQLTEIIQTDEGFCYIDKSGKKSEQFERIINTTGRIPNSDRLNAEEIGLTLNDKGLFVVDEWNQTNIKHIYAIGDVASELALTPLAIAASRRLIDHLFTQRDTAPVSFENVPTVVFSHPPAAKVGLTEEEARKQHGDDVRVYRASFRPMLNALSGSNQRDLYKVICTGNEEKIVGLHLLGGNADEILQGFAVAIKKGITIADFQDTIAIHPTSAEEVVLIKSI